MEISEILPVEAVTASVRVQSKKRLFQEISQIAASRFGLDETAVCGVLQDRESLGPTGVGRGVALPHGRVEGLLSVRGVFLRLEAPIEFDAVDRKPVDLVFALLAPVDAGAEHLKALARVSRLLREDAVCTKLRSTTDVQAIYSILTANEASKAA